MKTFVLDTNVLLQSPTALSSFGANIVVIPEAVLEELDSFKKDTGELGYCARAAIRTIEGLRATGNLIGAGVPMDNGGILRVEMNHYVEEIPPNWDRTKADNRILQVCAALKQRGEQVYLITKDVLERVKAEMLGLTAEDFENEMAPLPSEQYRGRRVVYAGRDAIDTLYANEQGVPVQGLGLVGEAGETVTDLCENEFLVVRSAHGSSQSALAFHRGGQVVPLRYAKKQPYGVSARNAGQLFFQEALLAPVAEAPLVIAKGSAGTAKTFLSLAAGLEKVDLRGRERREFRRILVCRPNTSMDEDLGYLPGTEQEKIDPLMRPVYDNLEVLVDSDDKGRYEDERELADKVRELFDRGLIITQAVGFLRGRSIARHWLIVDEAQNLTPKQVKGIITRAGEGTKIILIGDPDQIDHPYLDSRTNGLCYASDRMRGSRLCWQVTFEPDECVRSPLAAEGAERL
ncbi:MAG: PhoH family protein [Chloroflexota bacterium]